MLDARRRFAPLPMIRRLLVTSMAGTKLNVLHWLLSDYCRWSVESKLFPAVTSNLTAGRPDAGFYAQAEVVGLVVFAKARGARVVPEFEMPGHVAALRGPAGGSRGQHAVVLPRHRLDHLRRGGEQQQQQQQQQQQRRRRQLRRAARPAGGAWGSRRRCSRTRCCTSAWTRWRRRRRARRTPRWHSSGGGCWRRWRRSWASARWAGTPWRRRRRAWAGAGQPCARR